MELSRKLKEVGYPQEGEFWWNPGMTNKKIWYELREDLTSYGSPQKLPKGIIGIVAPLASELMEKLPKDIANKDNDRLVLEIRTYKNRNDEDIYEPTYYHPHNIITQTDTNFCNALARMYIYLAENKLLEVKNEEEE